MKEQNSIHLGKYFKKKHCKMSKYQHLIDSFMKELELKNSHEPEFIKAVEEVVEAVIPLIE